MPQKMSLQPSGLGWIWGPTRALLCWKPSVLLRFKRIWPCCGHGLVSTFTPAMQGSCHTKFAVLGDFCCVKPLCACHEGYAGMLLLLSTCYSSVLLAPTHSLNKSEHDSFQSAACLKLWSRDQRPKAPFCLKHQLC